VDWQPAVGARTVTAEAARYSRRDSEGIEDWFRTGSKSGFWKSLRTGYDLNETPAILCEHKYLEGVLLGLKVSKLSDMSAVEVSMGYAVCSDRLVQYGRREMKGALLRLLLIQQT
jgi:hypothetical protein